MLNSLNSSYVHLFYTDDGWLAADRHLLYPSALRPGGGGGGVQEVSGVYYILWWRPKISHKTGGMGRGGGAQIIMVFPLTIIQERHRTLILTQRFSSANSAFYSVCNLSHPAPPANSGTISSRGDRSLIIHVFFKRIILLELKTVVTTQQPPPPPATPVTQPTHTPCMSSLDTKSFPFQCNRVWFSSSFFVGTTYLS